MIAPIEWCAAAMPFPCTVDRRSHAQLLYRARCQRSGEHGRRSAAKLLSKDEARRIAANIAELPELGCAFDLIQNGRSPCQTGD
jgi:hypothetical protein